MKYYLFGIHACLAALQNQNRKIFSIHVSKPVYTKYSKIINLSKIKCNIEDDKFFQKISSATQHFVLFTSSISSDNYNIQDIALQKKIIILDNVQDSGNVGAIIRSAYAFGISYIIMPHINSATENGQMAKNAVGYLENIKLIYVSNITTFILQLKKHYFWIIGLSVNTNELLSSSKHQNSKLAFVFGSEEKGMKQIVEKSCDFVYKIPCATESLNISSSCAITLYEFNKV